MTDGKKELTVEIDRNLYSVVEEYCSYADVSEKHVVNYLIKNTLKEFSTNFYNLKQGYIEMGKINLEISKAFSASEDEALSHIKEE